MRLHELLGGVGVLGWVGDRGVDVNAITHDSRRATRGQLLRVHPGCRDRRPPVRGRRPLEQARSLCSSSGSSISGRARLGSPTSAPRSGRRRRASASDPSRRLRCLGVTGTNGKTTDTYLLEAIARAAGERVGLIGTVGARVDGAPLPLERTRPPRPTTSRRSSPACATRPYARSRSRSRRTRSTSIASTGRGSPPRASRT